jgi:hypothetical protein
MVQNLPMQAAVRTAFDVVFIPHIRQLPDDQVIKVSRSSHDERATGRVSRFDVPLVLVRFMTSNHA